jgi:hypothetical protein
VLLALVILGGVALMAHDDCPHGDPTITALRECVIHAASEGHIDDQRVLTSLLATLDAAQAAVDRGDLSAAVNLLEAFIRQLAAQAGQHVDAVHAEHLTEHAEAVIASLDG